MDDDELQLFRTKMREIYDNTTQATEDFFERVVAKLEQSSGSLSAVSGLGSAALRHGAHAGHPAPPGDDRLFADPEGHVIGLSSGM